MCLLLDSLSNSSVVSEGQLKSIRYVVCSYTFVVYDEIGHVEPKQSSSSSIISHSYGRTPPRAYTRTESVPEASQMVAPANVHGARPTDPFAARASKGERGVLLVLNLDQRVQHHRATVVQVYLVVLHARLLARLVGVLRTRQRGEG